MALMCEKDKFDVKMRYTLPFAGVRARAIKAHRKISFSPKAPTYRQIESYHILEPIKRDVCSKEVPFRDFRRIIEIEKQVLDKSLEELSLKLCSKLRVAIGLSEEFEADETALANLNSFLADLADERVDASELVKSARRRL